MKTLLTKSTTIFLFLCAITGMLKAQAPSMLWERFFNGNLSGRDAARSVITDDAGSVYVTGSCYHFFAGGNFTTIKYDSAGTQKWMDHYYSAQQGYQNTGVKLTQDKWGYVYAVGTLAINDGDLAISKYGVNGRIWTKNYQPYWFTTYDDFGIDMGTDTAGNFFAIAQVTSPSGNLWDLYIMKCDSAGNKLWDENYSGASAEDYPKSIAVSKSGKAYAALTSFNFFGTASFDICVRKYSSTGTPEWTTNYNGQGNSFDYPVKIIADDNDNTFVCGTADAGATNDMVCYRQNEYGTRLWTVTYNGTANANDTAISIVKLPNSLVAVTGTSKELVNGVQKSAIVTMVIDSGTVLWTQKYYGVDGLGATPTAMIIDNNGNLLISGYESTTGASVNGTIICYNYSGSTLWAESYDGGLLLNDRFNDIRTDLSGNILVTGQTFVSGTTESSYLTVKYGTPAISALNDPTEISPVLYPNPVNKGQLLKISAAAPVDFKEMKVISALGQIQSTTIRAAGSGMEIETGELVPGTYVLISSASSFKPVKFIVL